MDAENPLTANVGENSDAAPTAGDDPPDVALWHHAPQRDQDQEPLPRTGGGMSEETGSVASPAFVYPLFSFDGQCAADSGGPGMTASLFLSLILLVFAFFIVMVSLSNIDGQRSAGVIGSIAATFAPDVGAQVSSAAQGAQRGDVVDGEDLEQSLKGLFATELALAEFAAVAPGQVLQFAIAGDVLFHRGEARLRAVRSRLLDRLVATATIRPPGQRVDVHALISSGAAARGMLPTIPSDLAVRRAGALGEALVRRGLPRSQLAVGVWPETDDRVVFVFSIVAVDGEAVPDRAAVEMRPESR